MYHDTEYILPGEYPTYVTEHIGQNVNSQVII